MADNYLERQRDAYEARKAAWEKKKKHAAGLKKAAARTTGDGAEMLHPFASPTEGIELPRRFTYPFAYTPHPLCLLAAHEVQQYLAAQTQWHDELERGKMFGVLVVRTREGKLGYLAAFSGILAGQNRLPFFVPPVYDLLRPDGFFKQEEEQISALNRRIATLEADENMRLLKEEVEEVQRQADENLAEMRRLMKEARDARHRLRQSANLTPDEEAALTRESQHQKAEYKRAERAWQARKAALQTLFDRLLAPIRELKAERHRRSAALQMRLFWHFKMLNAHGEAKDLCTIFAPTRQGTPPAGAGECAAPKLLQQAYLHKWKPLCMAEFWWGRSPANEIREHGHFYPACTGKCGPILKHMLQGLDVDDNPLQQKMTDAPAHRLRTVYEDEWLLIVDKPAGLLSVPGRETDAPSVLSLMRSRLPQAEGPLVVHRLDMDTSGLMLIAKTADVHRRLQALFETRAVEKEYIALLQGTVAADSGLIDLPLGPSPHHRPCQEVRAPHAKPAQTRYEVLERREGRTLVRFRPLTGRTHQLRVHAAHAEGLGCPIVGDPLYGTPADRLYLHARSLRFVHPVTGQEVYVESDWHTDDTHGR